MICPLHSLNFIITGDLQVAGECVGHWREKNIPVVYQHVGLLNGESESAEHLARNPLGFVPVLEDLTTGKLYTESTAIIEYLDDLRPSPRLIHGDAETRLQIRTLAQIVNADIQPIQSLSVLDQLSQDASVRKKWAQHWIHAGFQAYEKSVQASAGKFSVGDLISMADLCLIPQCYNAERFGVIMTDYPTLHRIQKAALNTPSGMASHPDRFKPEDQQAG